MRGVLQRVICVPLRNAGGVSGGQHVVVHNVQRKAAVDGHSAAFVFVGGEIRRQVRYHVPNIHDAVTDVDVGVEETDKIVVAHPRFSPGVNNWGKIGDVIQQIRSGEGTESGPQAVSGDEQVLAFGRILLDEITKARAYGVVHQLKSLVHRATSGNGSVWRGNKIKIVKPVVEELGSA